MVRESINFSEQARLILVSAAKEAQRLGHTHIGTGHMLSALLDLKEGDAATILTNLGATRPELHSILNSINSQNKRSVGEDAGLTPRAKRAIELAVKNAEILGANCVDTEHLLLGLIEDDDGIAAGVLQAQNITSARVRVEVTRLRGLSG